MNLYVIWTYLTAFWATVVIGCLQPVNWRYCLPVQDWLFPAIGDYMRAREPYASERRILQSLERSDGLDGDRTNPGSEAAP